MIAWHSVNSFVYHTQKACGSGAGIEPWNARPGTGSRVLCHLCAMIADPMTNYPVYFGM